MAPGTRPSRGTDIILHVNEDGESFLEKYEMQDIAYKYCSFMAIPVYLQDKADLTAQDESVIDADEVSPEDQETGDAEAEEKKPQPINDPTPLYLKAAKDCTDEEYKEFYRKVFHDFKEPLFWIHLNMDYPYNLKGILFFPKLGN